ncbi:SRPBCC family protein [Streptacidiphilus sp. ASG 303]|uniref:SRPBCC family protein n=1 Tax=Streptacidiphilus sp. ASG 303 TaxID=2896847 RepID=UPI001E53A539|nr:SRPBCC family protein [Streptacidiphilus sp. ASG 303]MCD0480984.1 SRPBCC family protein [Streptacidiphilus sp. ASG 303]
MDPNHYRFASRWELAAPPGDAWRVLEDVPRYPLWWPEVRSVRRTDDRRGVFTVRSLLPYVLVFGAEQVRRDPAAGVLEAALDGDLCGWSRWTVTPRPGGSLVLFEEDVRPGRPLMRRLALPARPAFTANHALMMRSGRRGLAAFLAGYAAGRADAAGPPAG